MYFPEHLWALSLGCLGGVSRMSGGSAVIVIQRACGERLRVGRQPGLSVQKSGGFSGTRNICRPEKGRLCSLVCLEKDPVGRNGEFVFPIVLFQNQTAAKNAREERWRAVGGRDLSLEG